MIRRFLGAVDAAFDEEDAAKDRAFAGALDGFSMGKPGGEKVEAPENAADI